jgi:hypothetical protein
MTNTTTADNAAIVTSERTIIRDTSGLGACRCTALTGKRELHYVFQCQNQPEPVIGGGAR